MRAVTRARLRWQHPGMNSEVMGAFAAQQRARRLSPTTVRNRLSTLRALEHQIGDLLAATLHDLRVFLGAEHLAPGSARAYRAALIAFYTFCVEDGYRDDNPALRLDPISVPKGEPRPFTANQIDRMLNSGAYWRTRVMILLGYYQGFRVETIAAAHGSQFHLDSMTVTVRVKGGMVKTFPMHPVIAELVPIMPDDWWFPARGGRTGHITSSSVTNLITRAKHRAGITDPRLTPHSLRHSFGTDLVEGGVDIRVVQEMMGHASLSTTEIYTRVSERRKREAHSALTLHAIPVASGRGRDVPLAA